MTLNSARHGFSMICLALLALAAGPACAARDNAAASPTAHPAQIRSSDPSDRSDRSDKSGPTESPASTGSLAPIDRMSDTWPATDALGRALPLGGECPPPRPGKYVGIFYFLWLEPEFSGAEGRGVFDITKLLQANPDNPAWGPPGSFHHWGESELGYYYMNDEYVIRRHCDMFVDAGIDTLIFDASNSFTYDPVYLKICRVYEQIRAEGGRTPQIAFLAYNGEVEKVAKAIFKNLYEKNLYPDLWFRWKGKPLFLAPPAQLDPKWKDVFTIRETWAWNAAPWFGDGRDKWTWLDHHPQAHGWHEDPNTPEEVSVCVAQHPVTNIGRSFHNGKQPPPGEERTAEGLCFAEQWTRALDVDPEFIFITGWNEWIAQRQLANGTSDMNLGKPLKKGDSYFVDAYSQEFSRDIEPMKGGYGDNYYYQMIANIRRFKGARPVPAAGPPKTIVVDGDAADWDDVTPDFRDAAGDTAHRDAVGWGGKTRYRETSGRNDFVRLKVSRDSNNVYFLAETRAPVTPSTDPRWMLLFLDTDQDGLTGWNGYELRVGAADSAVAADASSMEKSDRTIERWIPAADGSGTWRAVATAKTRVAGHTLEMSIPIALLGPAKSEAPSFDFHWVDNPSSLDDTGAFFLAGDHAPNRRFAYRYNGGSDQPSSSR